MYGNSNYRLCLRIGEIECKDNTSVIDLPAAI